MESILEGSSTKRGEDVELTGPAATVRSLGRWLEQTPDAAVGVFGFDVGTRN